MKKDEILNVLRQKYPEASPVKGGIAVFVDGQWVTMQLVEKKNSASLIKQINEYRGQ